MLNRARPIGHLNIYRLHAQTVSLRILDQHRRHVEAHRLVVQNGARKGGEVLHLEICGRIRNQSEAGGVRLREAVECERADVLDDVLLRCSVQPVHRHTLSQFPLEIFHALPGASHSDSAAKLFGFRTSKIGNRHRHAKQLLLEERYA